MASQTHAERRTIQTGGLHDHRGSTLLVYSTLVILALAAGATALFLASAFSFILPSFTPRVALLSTFCIFLELLATAVGIFMLSSPEELAAFEASFFLLFIAVVFFLILSLY